MYRYLTKLIGPAALLALGALLGVALCYEVTKPLAHLSLIQRAVLQQYLLVYCDHSRSGLSEHEATFVSGEAAAMSRTTMAAGLGTLALAAYVQCKTIGTVK